MRSKEEAENVIIILRKQLTEANHCWVFDESATDCCCELDYPDDGHAMEDTPETIRRDYMALVDTEPENKGTIFQLTYDEYLDDNVDMLREMVKKVME